MNIQWYPGHMTRTRRQMAVSLKQVDAVCEVVDARIPQVSRNPDMDEIAGDKPRMIILNRTDLADPEMTRRWAAWYRAQGYSVLETDSQHGAGTNRFAAAARERIAEKIAQWNEKGQTGRAVRVMVVGIPNVGKSTFINRVLGRKSAKAADKPGVTRGAQWFRVAGGIDLLDTPGILWPKFDDETVGLHLAYTGAIRDEILDTEEIAVLLCKELFEKYPNLMMQRFKLSADDVNDRQPFEIFEAIGRARSLLISGGEVDTLRTARMLIDEFRDGKIGRITLEWPQKVQ